MTPSLLARIVTAALVVAGSVVFVAPAGAETVCGTVNQAYTPITVEHGPCVIQDPGTLTAVSADGAVKTGLGYVLSCALYLKVWRSDKLIVNTGQNGQWGCVGGVRIAERRFTGLPVGTRMTAQTWFDVRVQQYGTVVTHRFESLRAVLYTR